MNSQELSRKQLAAIIIGNMLEWYDFVVFSFMLVFISRLFFLPMIRSRRFFLQLQHLVSVSAFGLWEESFSASSLTVMAPNQQC